MLEAVSVKPNQSGADQGSLRPTPGRMLATNMSVRELITYAYGIWDFQIENLPAWTRRERFDIVARAPADVVTTAAMMRPVLADRFALRVRRESRQRPIYALVRSRDDGTLGPGLTPSTNPCIRGQADVPPCQVRIQSDAVIAVGLTWSATFLTDQITASAGRPVVDRTGLSGRFDITLRWTPDLASGAGPPATDERVSLFTALDEQLGLRLVPDTGAVDTLIVESVSRPTPD